MYWSIIFEKRGYMQLLDYTLRIDMCTFSLLSGWNTDVNAQAAVLDYTMEVPS